jgi:two-component system sensor histidine kinase/response regulator
MKFRDQPLRRKLTTVVGLAVGIGLAFSFLLYAANSLVRERGAYSALLKSLAEVVGLNSVAALEFGDRKAAEQTLAALSARTDVLEAVIYDRDGRLFAEFQPHGNVRRSRSQLIDPLNAAAQGNPLFALELSMFHPVFAESQLVGVVFIRADLSSMWRDLAIDTALGVAGMLVALLVALRLTRFLQTSIAEPVSQLARVMREVGSSKDYTLRLERQSGDEIGDLYRGFNRML